MRCVSVIGPSQSGKTTLCAALAELGENPARAQLGEHIEMTRVDWSGEPWSIIDCPGSIEFLPQCQGALLASDAVVICIGSKPEDAVLAAPHLRLAERSGTPTLLFINRIDELGGRVRDIVSAVQEFSDHAIVLRQIPIRSGGAVTGAVDLVSERAWRYREQQPSALVEIPADMIEREHEARSDFLEGLSDSDDWLLEQLVEEREPAHGPIYEICTRVLRDGVATPAFLGSASHGNGIRRLVKALRHEAPEVGALRERLALDCGAENAEDVQAVCFAAAHRKHVGLTTFFRALASGVAPGARLGGGALGVVTEPGARTTSEIAEGGVGAASKSDHLGIGQILERERSLTAPAWSAPPEPMTATVLTPKLEKDEAKLATSLDAIAKADPGLVAGKEEGTGKALVRAQGPVHLRRLREIVAAEFGVEVEEEPVGADYRETITKEVVTHYRHKKQTGGAGQFADIHLVVSPAERGEGLVFSDVVKGGAVPRNYIPAVEAGAADAMARGPLGFPVVDIKVVLTDGRHHSVDSSEFAFRTAARQGVSEALAKGVPVLLQPIHRVVFHVPSEFSGPLIPLVTTLRGRVLGFERDPDARGWDVFNALLPASSLGDLPRQLRAATQGTGYFEANFDHHEEVFGQEAAAILAERE